MLAWKLLRKALFSPKRGTGQMGTGMDFITGRDHNERKPGQDSERLSANNPDPPTETRGNQESVD